MANAYSCNLCKFSSKTKYNYEIHCKSIKHINNEKESTKCSCENCGNKFAHKKYLAYHLKKCTLKTNKEKAVKLFVTIQILLKNVNGKLIKMQKLLKKVSINAVKEKFKERD